MKTSLRLAACTAALVSLSAADARAQLIELPMGAGAAQNLTAHQIRVVQLALRDNQCYTGSISGRWTASTRTALQCARQRTNATDAQALARELALWSADVMPTRNAAGDVAPTAATPSASMPSASMPMRDTTAATMPMRDTTAMMRDTTMQMRDTTMQMRDTTMTPMRDTSAMAMPMRDTTAMPMRDTTAMPMRDTTAMAGAAGGSMLAMHLDSVVTAAETGFAGMPSARAGTLLQSLETQLASAPGLADLGPEFATLRTQLATTPLDSAQVGRTMTSLSTRISAAVPAAPADVQDRLRRLGTALAAEGRRLSP